jgi:sarcosine/dimethylglycine N-methyltransferase
MAVPAIKSMNLYSQVNRVYNDLRAAGIGPTDSIDVETLCRFDQYHYHGTEAVDQAIAYAGITAKSRILDVGAGIGGPARYIAHKTGCQVVALELQEDLNEVGQDLTARCGLSDRVTHLCGDILTESFEPGTFDAVVSWLCLYHIPDHPRLYSRLANALKPGGLLYAEDLYSLGKFTSEETVHLEQMLYGNSVLPKDEYTSNMTNAGFQGVEFTDLTDDWGPFVGARQKAHKAGFSDYAAIHGEEMAETLAAFYNSVARLFRSGNLGGVRVTATNAST